jgi:nucleotide-binding universal stress UspA family protein
MTDHTRPLLLGYLRKYPTMSDAELELAKKRLAEFAEREGFALGTVYVEHLHNDPAAFDALIEAANRYEVTAVVVPTAIHLSPVGALQSKKARLERETGARVLIAGSRP